MIRRTLDWVDGLLDSVTSYRLVLYSLLVFAGWAVVASLLGEISYEWYQIVASVLWLAAVCYGANLALSKWFNIPRNKESDLITALILALILSPGQELNDYVILGFAAIAAMASKYFLVWGKRHVFNPAAVGAFSAGIMFDYFPAWWIGTTILVPFVFVAGQLILRKMKRYSMVSVFMAIYIAYLVINFWQTGGSGELFDVIWLGLTATPVLFFAYVMLTEPSTSPHRLPQAVVYAALVGVLYSVGKLGIAPEEALLAGNLLAFVMAPNRRLELKFKQRRQEAKGVYSYLFDSSRRLGFNAGQYMEWTLPLERTDSRGNRRYFTVSSAPSEENLMFTVKQPAPSSTFKSELGKLKEGDKLLAYQLEGSFTLPKDPNKKLAFMAGGIGVTPFRSIIKDLLDHQEKRDIVMLYSANSADELAFTSLFKQSLHAGVTVHYAVSGETPKDWLGFHGQVDAQMIKAAMPDYKQRLFYISGPYGFVKTLRQTLYKLGVEPKQIKTDYFPGYG